MTHGKSVRLFLAVGTLAPAVDGLEFTHDQVFGSPSAASDVVLGRNSNGRLEWRIEGTRKTYAQWQAEQLPDIAEQDL